MPAPRTSTKPDKRNALDDDMVATLIDAVDRAGPRRGGARHPPRRPRATTSAAASTSSPATPRPRASSGRASASIQRRLPSQAHRLIPCSCTTQVPIVVRRARAGPRASGSTSSRRPTSPCSPTTRASGSRSASAASRPTAAARGCCPASSGCSAARELLLLGTALDGRTAVEWGLVHRAVAGRRRRRDGPRTRRAARVRTDRRPRAHQVAAAHLGASTRSTSTCATRRSPWSCRAGARTSAKA